MPVASSSGLQALIMAMLFDATGCNFKLDYAHDAQVRLSRSIAAASVGTDTSQSYI